MHLLEGSRGACSNVLLLDLQQGRSCCHVDMDERHSHLELGWPVRPSMWSTSKEAAGRQESVHQGPSLGLLAREQVVVVVIEMKVVAREVRVGSWRWRWHWW